MTCAILYKLLIISWDYYYSVLPTEKELQKQHDA